MTITTKEAERFARWCDTDGFTERATALRSLAAERDALQADNARLREALQSVLNACDQGRMLERGAVSLTIDVPDPANCYYGVPAWPIEEARAALGKEGDD